MIGMASYTGTTDATGKVALGQGTPPQVPAGTYTVSNVPPSGYTAAPAQTGVNVATGASVALTFQVQAPAGTLVVTVVDQFGNPVAGVKVTAQ